MSTEVKNTLFRFVTMRAPELSDEKDKDKRFIYRSDEKPDLRPFDKAVKERVSVTKWSAMQNCAFTPTTEDYLKVTFPEMYNLGVWIARNKYSFLTNELTIEIEKVQKKLTSNVFLSTFLVYKALQDKHGLKKGNNFWQASSLSISSDKYNTDLVVENSFVNIFAICFKDSKKDGK